MSVHVQLELGIWVTLPVGVDLGTSWQPSLPHLVVANLLPLFPPDMTAVRFTFKPLLGSFSVDDVFVDPRMRQSATRHGVRAAAWHRRRCAGPG